MKAYSGDFFKDLSRKLVEAGYRVFAPVKVKDFYLFKEVKSAQIPDDYVNTVKSVKEIVFPQNEVLIKYGDWIEEVPIDEEKKAVIGVRPCDAKALKLLDKVFLEDVVDPYYEARRKNTVLIGYACNKAGNYCFCKSLGLSPFGTEGLDLLVIKTDKKYLVDEVSDKGKEIAKLLDLEDATDEDLKVKEELEKKALESFRISINVENAKIMPEVFESDYWKEVALNCISCGVCTYLCPTCYCFDMLDEGEKRGYRYRCWDSCMFPLYTLETSSHNPRSEKWQRLRNRFYDKFHYMVKRKGEIFCVGCGRCIEFCPVGIDITEVINGLSR